MLGYDPATRITLGEALRHPFFERLATSSCQAKIEDMSRHVLRLQI
jgi:hypothetical protein